MRYFRTVLTVATLMLGPVFAEATDREARGLGDLPAKAVEASEWFIDILDDTTIVGPHIGVAYDDLNEKTYVSYYDAVNGDLWFAWPILDAADHNGNCGPDNTFNCLPVDTEGNVGMYNDIAVRASTVSSTIYISYFDETNHALKVMEVHNDHTYNVIGIMAPGYRTIQTGDPHNDLWYGKHTSVSQRLGVPIVAYQKGNAFHFIDEVQMVARPVAEDTGNCGEGEYLNDWQCDSIYSAEGAGQYASIDLDSGGNPSVAFYDPGLGAPVVATEVGGSGNCGPSNSWSCIAVPNGTDSTGKFLSLALEADGTPHLAYYNATDQSLEYATCALPGGNCSLPNWQTARISAMGTSLVDMGISIDLDPGGDPVIAHQDASDPIGPAVLAIARPWTLLPDSTPNCGPLGLVGFTWVCEWLDSGGATLSEARAVSLNVNQAGHAIVAYHELDDYPYTAEGKVKLAFEEPPLVFSDGFESGDFSFWSNVVTGTAP